MSVSGLPPASSSPTSRSRREAAGAEARAATRLRLLEAGQSLFAAKGLHGVTTHAIAKEAGVAAGTFYLHFPDKHALFREISENTVQALLTAMRSAAAPFEKRRDWVAAQTEALVRFAESNGDMMRILFSGDGEAKHVEHEVLEALAAQVEENRRSEVGPGDPEPALHPAVLSQALVGLLARVVAWWAEDPSRAPRQAVVDTLTRIQLSGTHPE